MDLLFSEEQTMLRDMTRRLCDDIVPLSVLREIEGKEPGYSIDLWKSLAEVGILGVTIAPHFEGLGLGAMEALVIHEEFGRALAFSPHFISSLLAARLIDQAGSDTQRKRWLPAIASGRSIVTVGSLEPGSSASIEGIYCQATKCADGFQLTGIKDFVPYASSAEAVIVLARIDSAPDAIVGLIVDLASQGVTRTYQPNHAREAQYQLEFANVIVSLDNVLFGGENIATVWEDTMFRALVPLVAQAVGGAARALEITVAYSKTREAFGKQIGGFQSIAHSLADVAVEVEGCRLLAQQAAWAQDMGRPFRRLAAIAQLQAGEMYRRAAAVAIQVHGGIGFSTAADPQLFFRRAKQLQLLNWSADYLEERIAQFTLQPSLDTGVQPCV